MASKTDPIAPQTWVAIDIAKGVNVALVERSDGRQQRFRFLHQRDDYDRLSDAAYQRGTLLIKRAKLMGEWATYCGVVNDESNKVIAFDRTHAR